jgi:hypothetical protein
MTYSFSPRRTGSSAISLAEHVLSFIEGARRRQVRKRRSFVVGTMSNSDLTTKFTKDTKYPDIFILNLRALRVLRGENLPVYSGCGFAALGSLRLILRIQIRRDIYET